MQKGKVKIMENKDIVMEQECVQETEQKKPAPKYVNSALAWAMIVAALSVAITVACIVILPLL